MASDIRTLHSFGKVLKSVEVHASIPLVIFLYPFKPLSYLSIPKELSISVSHLAKSITALRRL